MAQRIVLDPLPWEPAPASRILILENGKLRDADLSSQSSFVHLSDSSPAPVKKLKGSDIGDYDLDDPFIDDPDYTSATVSTDSVTGHSPHKSQYLPGVADYFIVDLIRQSKPRPKIEKKQFSGTQIKEQKKQAVVKKSAGKKKPPISNIKLITKEKEVMKKSAAGKEKQGEKVSLGEPSRLEALRRMAPMLVGEFIHRWEDKVIDAPMGMIMDLQQKLLLLVSERVPEPIIPILEKGADDTLVDMLEGKLLELSASLMHTDEKKKATAPSLQWLIFEFIENRMLVELLAAMRLGSQDWTKLQPYRRVAQVKLRLQFPSISTAAAKAYAREKKKRINSLIRSIENPETGINPFQGNVSSETLYESDTKEPPSTGDNTEDSLSIGAGSCCGSAADSKKSSTPPKRTLAEDINGSIRAAVFAHLASLQAQEVDSCDKSESSATSATSIEHHYTSRKTDLVGEEVDLPVNTSLGNTPTGMMSSRVTTTTDSHSRRETDSYIACDTSHVTDVSEARACECIDDIIDPCSLSTSSLSWDEGSRLNPTSERLKEYYTGDTNNIEEAGNDSEGFRESQTPPEHILNLVEY